MALRSSMLLLLVAAIGAVQAQPDCSNARCDIAPVCSNGFVPMVPDGDCCPLCLPAPPPVPSDQPCPARPCVIPDVCETTVVPERCLCPVCADGCSSVQCPELNCDEGFAPVIPGSHCCPVCLPTGPITFPPFTPQPPTTHPPTTQPPTTQPPTTHPTTRPPTTQPPTTQSPTRCPCKQDPCAITMCPADPNAECISDYCRGCTARFYADSGEEITDSCNDVPPPTTQCPIPGMEFILCASPCISTCNSPFNACPQTQCGPGCACPEGQVVNTRQGRCVPLNQCPGAVQCSIEGQLFTSCQTCPITCSQVTSGESTLCPSVCRPGCGCRQGQIIDEVNGRCVEREECPGSSTSEPTTTPTTIPLTTQPTIPTTTMPTIPTTITQPQPTITQPQPTITQPQPTTTPTIPTTTIPPTTQPTCPPGTPRLYCNHNPCDLGTSTCPAHPDATCVADYCGGCYARFYDTEGNEVTDTCNLPAVCPPLCSHILCSQRRMRNTQCTVSAQSGCTGDCPLPLTYCRACYYSTEEREVPGNCETCYNYATNNKCFRRWSRCVASADRNAYGLQSPRMEADFKCYLPPCQDSV